MVIRFGGASTKRNCESIKLRIYSDGRIVGVCVCVRVRVCRFARVLMAETENAEIRVCVCACVCASCRTCFHGRNGKR